MKKFKNILFIIEATVNQSSVLERAVSLAEKNQANLTIIDFISSVAEKDRDDTIAGKIKNIEFLIFPYRNRIKIQIDVLIGTAFIEVIRVVLRNSHDIVIKAAENPDFTSMIFGSNDMHLLRKCPCPVWLIKLPEKTKYDRILAAVDYDPLVVKPLEDDLNMQILDLAGSLALSDSASLYLVHTWEAYAEGAMRASGDISNASITEHVENQYSLHSKALYRLGEMLSESMGKDNYNRLNPSFHLPKGPAKKKIPELAAELNADIVVMGTVARTGISGFIIGNTAETILNQLDCSVIAVKPEGFITPVKLAE